VVQRITSAVERQLSAVLNVHASLLIPIPVLEGTDGCQLKDRSAVCGLCQDISPSSFIVLRNIKLVFIRTPEWIFTIIKSTYSIFNIHSHSGQASVAAARKSTFVP